MARASQNGGARSLSWKPEEDKELLSLWGEEKVKDALRNHHCNIDTFESIVKGTVWFRRDSISQRKSDDQKPKPCA